MQKSAMIVYEERRDDDTHPSLGKPFRVQAKLRNNRMINARKMMGFETITSAANAIGIPVGSLCDLEGFKDSPWSKRNGTWNRNAIRIAAFYQYGTANFQGVYAQLVDAVGNTTSQLTTTGTAETNLLTAVTKQQQSISFSHYQRDHERL